MNRVISSLASHQNGRFLVKLVVQEECGGWTNERHNSYLEYLENSFVKQLYSLLGGEERRRLSTAHDLQSNSHISTDDQVLYSS